MSQIKPALVILSIAVLVGCSSPAEVTREPIGAVVSADSPPSAWNEYPRTIVRTERAVVTVQQRIGRLDIGAEAYIITRDNGLRYLWWQGADSEYRLWRPNR